MKPEDNPPRLIESSEFSDVLTKASQSQWSEAHINERRRAIVSGVAALTATGVASSAAAASSLATFVKAGAFIIVLGAVSTGVYLTMDEEPEHNAAEIIVTIPDAGHISAPPIDAASPLEIDAGLLILEPAKSINAEPVESIKTKTKPPKVTQLTPPTEKQTTLSAQLELIRDAKAAAKQSNYRLALTKLESLSSEDPSDSLFMEAQFLRLEYLVILNRNADGLRLVRSLLAQPIAPGKKAELLLLQGDFLLKSGNCSDAQEAFRRALGYGLAKAETERARQGLEKCAAE